MSNPISPSEPQIIIQTDGLSEPEWLKTTIIH